MKLLICFMPSKGVTISRTWAKRCEVSWLWPQLCFYWSQSELMLIQLEVEVSQHRALQSLTYRLTYTLHQSTRTRPRRTCTRLAQDLNFMWSGTECTEEFLCATHWNECPAWTQPCLPRTLPTFRLECGVEVLWAPRVSWRREKKGIYCMQTGTAFCKGSHSKYLCGPSGPGPLLGACRQNTIRQLSVKWSENGRQVVSCNYSYWVAYYTFELCT